MSATCATFGSTFPDLWPRCLARPAKCRSSWYAPGRRLARRTASRDVRFPWMSESCARPSSGYNSTTDGIAVLTGCALSGEELDSALTLWSGVRLRFRSLALPRSVARLAGIVSSRCVAHDSGKKKTPRPGAMGNLSLSGKKKSPVTFRSPGAHLRNGCPATRLAIPSVMGPRWRKSSDNATLTESLGSSSATSWRKPPARTATGFALRFPLRISARCWSDTAACKWPTPRITLAMSSSSNAGAS